MRRKRRQRHKIEPRVGPRHHGLPGRAAAWPNRQRDASLLRPVRGGEPGGLGWRQLARPPGPRAWVATTGEAPGPRAWLATTGEAPGPAGLGGDNWRGGGAALVHEHRGSSFGAASFAALFHVKRTTAAQQRASFRIALVVSPTVAQGRLDRVGVLRPATRAAVLPATGHPGNLSLDAERSAQRSSLHADRNQPLEDPWSSRRPRASLRLPPERARRTVLRQTSEPGSPRRRLEVERREERRGRPVEPFIRRAFRPGRRSTSGRARPSRLRRAASN